MPIPHLCESFLPDREYPIYFRSKNSFTLRNVSDRGRGTRARNVLRYIYPQQPLLSSGSSPKYAIDSIDWIQDEISSDDNERPPPRISLDPALRTPCCTPLVLSSCEQRKARKSLWPRLDRKIAPHRTKRACLWDLLPPFPSTIFSLLRARCEQMLPDFVDRGSITRPEEIENKKRTTRSLLCVGKQMRPSERCAIRKVHERPVALLRSVRSPVFDL